MHGHIVLAENGQDQCENKKTAYTKNECRILFLVVEEKKEKVA
jgi:hypothetical protein